MLFYHTLRKLNSLQDVQIRQLGVDKKFILNFKQFLSRKTETQPIVQIN